MPAERREGGAHQGHPLPHEHALSAPQGRLTAPRRRASACSRRHLAATRRETDLGEVKWPFVSTVSDDTGRRVLLSRSRAGLGGILAQVTRGVMFPPKHDFMRRVFLSPPESYLF